MHRCPHTKHDDLQQGNNEFFKRKTTNFNEIMRKNHRNDHRKHYGYGENIVFHFL